MSGSENQGGDIVVTADTYVMQQQMAFYGYSDGAKSRATVLPSVTSTMSIPANAQSRHSNRRDERIEAYSSISVACRWR